MTRRPSSADWQVHVDHTALKRPAQHADRRLCPPKGVPSASVVFLNSTAHPTEPTLFFFAVRRSFRRVFSKSTPIALHLLPCRLDSLHVIPFLLGSALFLTSFSAQISVRRPRPRDEAEVPEERAFLRLRNRGAPGGNRRNQRNRLPNPRQHRWYVANKSTFRTERQSFLVRSMFLLST